MSISGETWRSLKGLGLTQYEIKAYIALLAKGPMQANAVSREADIPYSKIYDVLSNLEKKGWIETDHDRPARYYPKSPSTAVETVKMKFESELKRSEAQIISELQPIYESKDTRETPKIWIVRGEFNILTKIREAVSRCEAELLIAVPTILREAVELLAPILTVLKSRGIGIAMMTTRDVDPKLLTRLSHLSELRVRDQMFGGGVIRDAKEVIILLGEDGVGTSTLAIWSEHPGLARFAKSYFTYLWNEARPYE